MKLDTKLRSLAIFTGIVVIYLLLNAYSTKQQIQKLDSRINELTIKLEENEQLTDRITQTLVKQQELNDLVTERLLKK